MLGLFVVKWGLCWVGEPVRQRELDLPVLELHDCQLAALAGRSLLLLRDLDHHCPLISGPRNCARSAGLHSTGGQCLLWSGPRTPGARHGCHCRRPRVAGHSDSSPTMRISPTPTHSSSPEDFVFFSRDTEYQKQNLVTA